ncbi:acyltransferase family protein [Demequina sp.]|uniref:acyltransferase family protein n=1 Tax=Demequina sp. TaxID=2050685 RepID=UPI003A88748A
MAESRRMAYVPQLDGMRAVGVLLVLVTHGARPYSWPGGFGVDIFFVLSGYLITSLLILEWEGSGRIAFGRFYVRRFIRLYPALLTYLAATIPLGLLLVDDIRAFLIATAASSVYLNPIAEIIQGPSVFYGHLWTLAFEEYFYLAWPVAFVMLLHLRLTWKTRGVLMLAGGVALYGAYIATYFVRDAPLELLRVGGIALGCGLAIVLRHTTRRGNARLLAGSALACLVLACVVAMHGVWGSLAPLFAALGSIAMILSILTGRATAASRVLGSGPLTFVGRISYELYLWHPTVLIGGALALGTTENAIWWWAYPVSFGLAVATHYGYAPLQRRWRRQVDGLHEARVRARVV